MATVSSQVNDVFQRTHAWLEAHSGWAPPDTGSLAELAAEGLCRAPDDCLVATEGVCEHGLASWALLLAELDRDDRRRAQARARAGRGLRGSGSGPGPR